MRVISLRGSNLKASAQRGWWDVVPMPLPGGQIVELDDHAVDLVVEVVAVGLEGAVVREDLVHRGGRRPRARAP